MKNKILILIVTFGIILSFSLVVSAQEEVTKEQAALTLQELGLLQGDNGDLMLDQVLTREQMMVIISRLLGIEDMANQYSTAGLTFKDVPGDSWAAPYIAWAKANKITEGYSPEEFGYEDSLTGWQTKTFFVRTLGYSISDEEMDAKAQQLGITKGSNVSSDQPMLRGEMALLMYNTLFAQAVDNKVLGEKLSIIDNDFIENEAIKAVIFKNIIAGNTEDINMYMDCIDPTIDVYEQTRALTEQIFEMYDLKYEIKTIRVVGREDNLSEVRVTQLTKRISGPDFIDYQGEIQNLLKKVDGKWKIYETNVINAN